MAHTKQFADLRLEQDALHTPVGMMPLSEIVRAEFVREVVHDGPATSTQEASAPAVVGGAAVGAVVFGPVGAVAGGLLGSTAKEDVPGRPAIHTKSVTLIFETSDVSFSMDVPRDQEVKANDFANAVRRAAKHIR